ncbi:Protein of unknown function [Bacillus cereus]|nr:Protein of unknown function [Bacillus cereus]
MKTKVQLFGMKVVLFAATVVFLIDPVWP